jgi:hypothetical protein
MAVKFDPLLGQLRTSDSSTGGDKTYVQAFTTVSSVVVTHNLSKQPSVTIVDSSGIECEGDVAHNTINQLTLTFSASFSGNVYCN